MRKPEELRNAFYLGDSVYVGSDECQVWLITFNGIETTNEIALEPGVIEAFIEWLRAQRIILDRKEK